MRRRRRGALPLYEKNPSFKIESRKASEAQNRPYFAFFHVLQCKCHGKLKNEKFARFLIEELKQSTSPGPA